MGKEEKRGEREKKGAEERRERFDSPLSKPHHRQQPGRKTRRVLGFWGSFWVLGAEFWGVWSWVLWSTGHCGVLRTVRQCAKQKKTGRIWGGGTAKDIRVLSRVSATLGTRERETGETGETGNWSYWTENGTPNGTGENWK